MRFAERFLILLALIALILQLTGSKDGPTLELIGMPLLALFYLIGSSFLIQEREGGAIARPLRWQLVLLRIICGVGIAYCIISLMLYTIGWVPRPDMLERCGLIIVLLSVALFMYYRKWNNKTVQQFLLRIGILAAVIVLACFLPFGKR